jgi:hypothetical protein
VIKELKITPNPANDHVDLGFVLNEPGPVQVAFSDIFGRNVMEQTFNATRPGEQRFIFETTSLPAGLYIVKAQAGGHVMTGKILVTR